MTGIPDGNTDYNATWAVETNYYMDLGFLPESIKYFAISGRAGLYGPKGAGASRRSAIQATNRDQDRNQPRTDPSDLRRQQGLLGPKYAHFVDVWVAYRYWENKFGLNDQNVANGVCYTLGVSNRSCTEKSFYAGVTAKF